MDCVRAQKLIRPYLDGKLSDRELEEFLDHVESCPACHDELEIYFSIYQTLGEETDDGDYNFTRKLDEKLQRSEQYLTRRHIFRSMKIVLIVCAELFFIAAFSGLVTRELGEVQSTIEMVETEESSHQGVFGTIRAVYAASAAS